MKRFGLLTTLAALALAATASAQNPQLPVPLDTTMRPVPSVVLAAPVLPVVRAQTLRDFACSDFRAGTYSVYVIHPCTNCPVKVCFSLPVCPRKVRSNSTTLELRWGALCCKRVIVRFLPDGTVSVRG